MRSLGRLYNFVGVVSMLRWFWPATQSFSPANLASAHHENYVNNKNWAAQMMSFGLGNETTLNLKKMAEQDAAVGK